MKPTLDEARRSLKQAEAELDYHLEKFGDHLRKEHGYSVSGIEAVWAHLIRLHHWTPAYVKSMKGEDIRLALDLEIREFRI